jgi:hypothetical protein
VIGNGTPDHRAVAVALAQAGADIAVAGNPGTAEVLLHSISNELWAIGRRSIVAGLSGDAAAFAAVCAAATAELGRLDLTVQVDAIIAA